MSSEATKAAWIDLNGNGKKDQREEVTGLSNEVLRAASSSTIAVYGKMYNFFCENNEIISLDISNCKSLVFISCYDNLLSSLDVSKNEKLRVVYINGNNIRKKEMDKIVKNLRHHPPQADGSHTGYFKVVDADKTKENNSITKG